MKGKQWLSITLGIVTATGGFLDAGTIVTSSEAGAKFGLGLVGVILIATIAVIMLVEMSGRLAAVSGKAYAETIRERFGFKFYLLPLTSETIAETLLLAAEIGGVAIAVSLITGISWHILFPVVAVLVWGIAWRGSFSFIENTPALLGIVTLSFVAGVIALGGPQPGLWQTLWHPRVKQDEVADYFYLAAAILGATVSPYLFFFYSSGAREEHWSKDSLRLNRITAIVGMAFGSLGSLALVFLGAIVLQPRNLSASTLGEVGLGMAQPFGAVGSLLFAVGLFGTCLGAALEVLLALSYNVAQGFGWEWGKNKKPIAAARFNLTMTLVLLAATAIGLFGVDPLQLALIASTLIALFLPISLSPFLVIMNDQQYLQEYTNGRLTNIFLVAVLLIAFFVAVVSIPLVILSGGG
ncbi:MAG: NRAMP family divalent metal transporter [Ktedonobacterales bacterium]